MEPTASLADAIYRPSVLGPDRNGPRRALSLGLSGGTFLTLAGLAFLLGTRAPERRTLRPVATVTFDFTEELPPPPPPAGPLAASQAAPATGAPAPVEAIPDHPTPLTEVAPAALPMPGPASAASGGLGGQPGGVAGGQPGGVAGGKVGGDPAGILPPQFDAAYLRNPEPDYPALSRRLREEGRVVLRVLVTEEGAPQQVELRQTSGHPRLDQAALEAVRRWRFAPARRGADRLAAWVLVPLAFSLDA